MWKKEVEVVLARQLASYLAMPIFIADTEGNLLFYNEPAEIILGRRFQETGELPASELAQIFQTTDESGAPVPAQELPVMIALQERRPAHRSFSIRGMDGKARNLEATAIPLIGISNRFMGVFVLFWEAHTA